MTMYVKDLPATEREAAERLVRETNPAVALRDVAQAELRGLDERIAAAQAEIAAIDAQLHEVTLDSDLVTIGALKLRRPLLNEQIGRLRVAAQTAERQRDLYQARIDDDLSARLRGLLLRRESWRTGSRVV